MKTSILTLLIICAVVIVGSIISLDFHKSSAAPKPAVDTPASEPADQAPVKIVSVPLPQPTITPNASTSAQMTVSSPSAPQVAPTNSVSPIHKLVEALLSAASRSEKNAVFDDLRTNGELNDAIADLKQMAAANPNNAEIPTTIGEAELNECRALSENGAANIANTDQMGILAMQADQEFNSALQIDPKNWEAQFVKASAMYYWPANPKFNNQLVQNLTSLIDEQETLPPSPDYAQTYVLLGNEYQKIGQQDKATATWQLGAQEYPNDSALQKKLAGPPGQ